MEVNTGKYNSNNIFLKSLTNRLEENIFANNNSLLEEKNGQNQNQQSSGNRLNDYDSNILENNAYLEIPDDMLKIEHRIGVLENSLSKIKNEIATLESFGANIQITELKARKESIEKTLSELNKHYSELGLSAKISGQIASAVKFTSGAKLTSFDKTKKFIKKNILAKLSKKINYSENMKEALEKLNSINLNVDELISLKVPHGETKQRYEKLTAYLNKANTIHANISKNLKEMK